MRYQRLPSIYASDQIYRRLNDHISMSHTDEMYQYVYYKDLARKGCLKNIFFKMRYLYRKYPYRINKKKLYYQYIIKNYFNITDTSIKILKKFLFFEKGK